MGQVEQENLLSWCQKVVGDDTLLAEDKDGNKIGSSAFREPIVKTFCNFGVQRICRGVGYEMPNLMANDLHDYLQKNWIKPRGLLSAQMEAAFNAAMLGDLAVLSYKHDPHGHIAVVAPIKPMLYSGHWSMYCPQVANIGQHNGFMGANYAFKEVPDIFILGRVLQ